MYEKPWFTAVKLKRIDQVQVGDIVRITDNALAGVRSWAEVMSVDVDEEYPATKLTVFRPPTRDGSVTAQRGRVTTRVVTLPSFDLLDVQVTVS